MRILSAPLLVTALVCGVATLSMAQQKSLLEAEPSGRVILTVSGSIDPQRAEGEIRLDRAMLESLGITSFTTTTPWTEGEVEVAGVLAHDLMRSVGARGKTVTAVALNDYKAEIPLSDFEQFGVLLALEINGKTLSVREKGPIWIIYPAGASDHDSSEIRSKMVWQLKELRVE